MDKKKALSKLKAMDEAIEIALHEWVTAGEDLELARDKRDRFFKKYRKFLLKVTRDLRIT